MRIITRNLGDYTIGRIANMLTQIEETSPRDNRNIARAKRRATQRTARKCVVCLTKPASGVGRSSKCDDCRNTDEFRHWGRKYNQILVHVDTEGDGNDNTLCASYGREDGSSDTLFSSDPVEILKFWMVALHGKWHGKTQIAAAFIFNYDSGMLVKPFLTDRLYSMRLIMKARVQENYLCDFRTHKTCARKPGDKLAKDINGKVCCLDIDNVIEVIKGLGELPFLAYDPRSHMAIATTPNRRFYAEYRPKGENNEGYLRLDIHDQGKAFTGGLEKVIDDWRPELTNQQRSIIQWGKMTRTNAFNPIDVNRLRFADDESYDVARMIIDRAEKRRAKYGSVEPLVAEYSESECIAAARCARLLINNVKESAGVHVQAGKLFGAGSVAAAVLKKYGVATRDETVVNEDIDYIAKATYFGGMIETPCVGFFPGRANEEDINSAYSHVMRSLPCMRDGHGQWNSATYNQSFKKILSRPGLTVGHARITWFVHTEHKGSTPPFMVRRSDGRVAQTLFQENIWVPLPELATALKRYRHIKIHEIVWWEPKCKCGYPFKYMEDAYIKRLDFKRLKGEAEEFSPEYYKYDAYQNAIKLGVLNSAYGKLAQQRPTLGEFTNLHYASMITAGIRSIVRERTWRREDEGGIVIYQHTDAAMSVNTHVEDEGNALGAWGLETKKKAIDLVICQPGLMTSLYEDESHRKMATRGVNRLDFFNMVKQWAKTNDFTKHPSEWDKLIVPGQRMITLRQAMVRKGGPNIASTWEDHPLTIQFDSDKRNYDNAVPIDGIPTAWIIPPLHSVDDPASESDIAAIHEAMIRATEDGNYDHTEERFGGDEWAETDGFKGE